MLTFLITKHVLGYIPHVAGIPNNNIRNRTDLVVKYDGVFIADVIAVSELTKLNVHVSTCNNQPITESFFFVSAYVHAPKLS